ncbi:Angiotensin-converting enzyme [Lamellibrachia satsuma]|nr:Angiotensin-converting enzyme [Lamellibrachia satsuma]
MAGARWFVICVVMVVARKSGSLSLRETEENAASRWLTQLNKALMSVRFETTEADWNYATNITEDNQQQKLLREEKLAAFAKEAALNASHFKWQDFSNNMKRQFKKITDIGTAILPENKLNQMNRLAADLTKMYSTAKVCDRPNHPRNECFPLDPDLTEIMAKSRNWNELLWAWKGWRDASSRQMSGMYTHFIEFQNEAAQTNGYADTGDYWRAKYETADFEQQLARLWRQVRPLYEQLHAYVARKLRTHYKDHEFPSSGHIPAHLLGNMWAQTWTNIKDIVRPYPNKTSVDVTSEMLRQGYNATRLFLVSEEFFTSLGLIPMPEEFWNNSMIRRPSDGREVVCHASAWDFFNQKDFRIKQCSEVTQEWLFTTHHEMGHIQYFLQYKDQPVWFRDGANAGFHEAIGDVMELSVNTPAHLHKIGLLPILDDDSETDINYLMSVALKKVAFLPFGYLIDQWRWKVFSGEAKPADYNKAWWKLRCQYQGVAPPVERTSDDFDPGAKFHVPNNTPYIRYFVSFIVQFQFHKALCDAAGHHGPLHQCDIYRSKEAGKLIGDMLKLGSSVPWTEAMLKIAGTREMDAAPLLEFFRPVIKFLEKENEGHRIGWDENCPDAPKWADVLEEEAKEWLRGYNADVQEILSASVAASWAYSTNLTEHNQNVSLVANAKVSAFEKKEVQSASRFPWKNFTDPLVRREFAKITNMGNSILPADELGRLHKLRAQMQQIYSTARVCDKPGDTSGQCYPLDPDVTNLMATSVDWDELLWAWVGWRNVTGREMPELFEQFVSLQNRAARTNGYADQGAYLRSEYQEDGSVADPGYDFERDIERLWREVRPLYEQLHAYARRRLQSRYVNETFPQTGHIPAHLLGNMWAQSWSGIESLLRPFPNKTGVDVTEELQRQGYDATRIFKLSEEFFTSLGLISMPKEFWNKSMITKPADRDVVCHASAWDFYNQKDFRIKQCTEITMPWVITTHHEMGHIQYYLQYKDQPVNFRRGGNPGFHEAIGDVMALSVSTPKHLQEIGLLKAYTPDAEVDLNFLMSQSLKKLAFLPFGYLIDQWRWDIYAGRVSRDTYNEKWWEARCRFQGISPPVERNPRTDFDAGAKYHVPANTPYIRYFVSHILQFQFQKSLCEAAGHEGPLYTCDIYRSKKAGKLIGDMMKLGSSVPWPEALVTITGSRRMSAEPLVEYFAPLLRWLKEENRGHSIGWNEMCRSA